MVNSNAVLLLILLAAFVSIEGRVIQKIVFTPGLKPMTHYFKSGYTNTEVIHNFNTTVGVNSFTLDSLDDAGFYTLKVHNSNGSFYDTDSVVKANPAWMCIYTQEEYFYTPLPSSFFTNRTAALPCTITGSPRPQYNWKKYIEETAEWKDIGELGLLGKSNQNRYILSQLGHLYIKYFSQQDAGLYRCTAHNVCGRRCLNESTCTGEMLVGQTINLTVSENDSTKTQFYFLNNKVENCWDKETGITFKGEDYDACVNLPLRNDAGHVGFRQFVSIGSSPSMEALVDFKRPHKTDYGRNYVGTVEWERPYHHIENFEVTEDPMGHSGLCYASIRKFIYSNMEEYYYCVAYHSNNRLLQLSLRFEFIMREIPNADLPSGVKGQQIHKYKEVHYGEPVKIMVSTKSGKSFRVHKIGTKYMCLVNTKVIISADERHHRRCDFREHRDNIAYIYIDYAVFGDSGFYQVIVGNDEGYTVGPTVLLKVTGTEIPSGNYSLIIEEIKTNSIRVGWNVPRSAVNETESYLIEYKNLDWDESKYEVMTKEQSIELKGLKAGVRYSIYVTLKGGLVADTKTISTKGTITNAKINVKCIQAATSISCDWKQPSIRLRHGRIYSYMVYVKSRSNPFGVDERYEVEKAFRTMDTNMTIANLAPFSTYDVTFVVCNEIGCSGNNVSMHIQTTEDRPKMVEFKQPPKVSFYSIFFDLKVPVPRPGRLTTEVIIYKEKDFPGNSEAPSVDNGNDTSTATNKSDPHSHIFSDSQFSLNDLEDDTYYHVKLRWRTTAGPGPYTKFYKLKTYRFINYKYIFLTCGLITFIIVLGTAFYVYVRRRWPGLAKSVIDTVRDKLNPSYEYPNDNMMDWEHAENDDEVVYVYDTKEI